MTLIDEFCGSPTLKNKVREMKNILFDDVEKRAFKDITNDWVKLLKRDRRMPRNSFIFWCIGGRGAGKTANEFKMTDILLKKKERNVAFFRTPEVLIHNIENSCPEEIKGRFRTIHKLRELKANDIFIIDEGLLGANAKEALKTEMRNLIKSLSKSRHPNIITIINSVSLGILSEFRDVVDITMYKRLTRVFINNPKNKNMDPFIAAYGDVLTKLKPHEAILLSSYHRFDNEGYISMELEEFCPWFTDDISRYHKNTSSDVVFDETERLRAEHQKIVEWIISIIKDKYHNVKRGFQSFRMWLYKYHNDVWFDNKSHLKRIYELYCYYWDEGLVSKRVGMTDKEASDVDLIVRTINSQAILKDWEVVEKQAINRTVRKAKKRRNLLRDLEIYKKRNTIKVPELITEYQVSEQSIYSAMRKIKGEWKKNNGSYEVYSVNYHKGMIFEMEFARFLKELKIFDKVIRKGGSGEPDIIAYKDNKEYVFSLKNRDLNRKHLTILINPKDIRPELLYCAERDDNTAKYLFIAVLNNDNNKVFCFYHDKNSAKTIDLRKMKNKYLQ